MKIIICGHARFSEGIASAQELIAGKMSEVVFLNSYIDGIDFRKEIKALLPDDEECCVLTDLFGGSVNQEVMKYLKNKNIHVVAGVNLPLILELVIKNSRESLNEESIRKTVGDSRNQMIYVNDQLKNISTDDFD